MSERGVFFDFGGTLARGEETLDEPWKVWVRAADHVGLRLDPVRVRELNKDADRRYDGAIYQYHGRTEEFWRLRDGWVIDQLGVRSERRAYLEAIQAIFNDCERIHLYPETLEVLREVKGRGYRLGVISNFTDSLVKVLQYHGLSAFFDSVTYSQAVGEPKPGREIFRRALKSTGCGAADSLHIGDSWDADYLGAVGAGMEAVWLNREARPPPAPCREVRDLKGLVPLLERW